MNFKAFVEIGFIAFDYSKKVNQMFRYFNSRLNHLDPFYNNKNIFNIINALLIFILKVFTNKSIKV